MKIDKSWYIKPKNIPVSESAGGIVVRIEKGNIMIALLGDKKFKEFSLPKGRIEKGESEIEAAKREISEEIGLTKLECLKKLGIKERLIYKKTSWRKIHYFLFKTKQISGKQKLEKAEQDYFVKWFDINKLPEIFWPDQKELIERNREKIKKLVLVDGNNFN